MLEIVRYGAAVYGVICMAVGGYVIGEGSRNGGSIALDSRGL